MTFFGVTSQLQILADVFSPLTDVVDLSGRGSRLFALLDIVGGSRWKTSVRSRHLHVLRERDLS